MKAAKYYKSLDNATRRDVLINTMVTLSAVAIIILFLNTGLGKITSHDLFVIQMEKQPLPVWSKPILIYALPFLELGTVFLLCTAQSRFLGFTIATILLFSYTIYVYLAYIELYGYVICACGKIFQSMGWRDHFFVNAIFTVLAIVGTTSTFKSNRRQSSMKQT